MKNIKTLTLIATGLSGKDIQAEENDETPRASLYEKSVNSDMMGEEFLQKAPYYRRFLYRYIPTNFAHVTEAFFIRKRYDVIVSWTDVHALLFGLLLKLTGKRYPNIALMFWISKPKKAALLKRVHKHIDIIILWTSTHKEFAIKKLGIEPSKIRFIPYYVDEKFWRPLPAEQNLICSVGVEMRDYPTLIEAMRKLDMRCHIAAGASRGIIYDTVKAIYNCGPIPSNITVGKLEPLELRNIYASSRFVVIPLLPSDSDNGLTSILEAMAMGKAVICSRTKGQIDVIRDGVTGIFVPQGNPEELRKAIKYLWDNPSIADKMGLEGRKQIETNNSLEKFVNSIRNIIEETYIKSQINNKNKIN
jgi:glycosyltransferase involved in cell wall biosynthesis